MAINAVNNNINKSCNCGACDKHSLEKILHLVEEATKDSKIKLNVPSQAAIKASLIELAKTSKPHTNGTKPH